jgi:integrase
LAGIAGTYQSGGSYLAAHGVEPKVVMEIMRHKDINLTMSRYTHLLSGQKQKAVNKLPRFGKSKRQEKTA